MRVSLCPSGEKILDGKEGKTMHVILWVCFVLLILGNEREVPAAAPPAKMVIGFAAMNARVVPFGLQRRRDFLPRTMLTRSRSLFVELLRSMPRCCPAIYKRATRRNGRDGRCGR